jgi:hypothetical protein
MRQDLGGLDERGIGARVVGVVMGVEEIPDGQIRDALDARQDLRRILLVLVVHHDQALRRHPDGNVAGLVQESVVGVGSAAVGSALVEGPPQHVEVVFDLLDLHRPFGPLRLAADDGTRGGASREGDDQHQS